MRPNKIKTAVLCPRDMVLRMCTGKTTRRDWRRVVPLGQHFSTIHFNQKKLITGNGIFRK